MSPMSWPVILGTILVGSPALWAAQVSGTLSADVAMMRLLICLAAVWATCTVVATLADRTVQSNKMADEAVEAEALAVAAAAAAAHRAEEQAAAEQAAEAAGAA